jgi:tetratricopeptide (TPR) repeat protein/S1-C subfamily serine protease
MRISLLAGVLATAGAAMAVLLAGVLLLHHSRKETVATTPAPRTDRQGGPVIQRAGTPTDWEKELADVPVVSPGARGWDNDKPLVSPRPAQHPGPMAQPQQSATGIPPPEPKAAEQTLPDLVEKVEPSVVQVNVTRPKGAATGSGFVVDKQGTIVTNFHVIQDATGGTVIFSDKTTAPIVGYLGAWPEKDLAIIRVRRSADTLHPIPLAPALPRKGSRVATFGSPEGLSQSVSEGIVSAIRQGAEVAYFGLSQSDTWVQTTAPISPGNSGGPLVNMTGEVVGVNTLIYRGLEGVAQNLNFAVSTTDVRSALSETGDTVLALPVPREHQEEVNARPEVVDLTHDPSGAALLAGVRKVAVLVTEAGTTATAKLDQLVLASAQGAFRGSDLQVVAEASRSDALLFVNVGVSGPSHGSDLDYVVEAFVCQRQTLSDGTVRLAIIWSDFRQETAPSIAAVGEVRHLAQSLFEGLLLARGGAGPRPFEPTVRPPAYDAAADEAQARTLLNSAKSLAAAGRPAAKWLWRVVGKHPLTRAAQEARQLLIDFYSGLIREDPGNGEAYRQRAEVYVSEDDFDKAIADFTEAIGRDPQTPWAYYGRAVAYFEKHDYDAALTDCAEAVRLDPKSAVAYYNRAMVYVAKGDNDMAIADFTEAIRLDPKDAAAYYNRSEVYGYKGDYDAAITDSTEAIRLDPKSARAYANRGCAYGNKGEWDKAIADHTEAIRLDPKLSVPYCFRGLAYGKKGEWDKAIADYTEGVRLDPKNDAAFFGRGWAYGQKGDYDKAIADYTEAIRLDPKDAAAYYFRGRTYVKKGETTKAAADSAKAKELSYQPPK